MASPSASPFATCFYPNGSPAHHFGACGNSNGNDGQQTCCPEGSTCLASNMCATGSDTYVRGACTDATWTSSGCPAFCVEQDLGSTTPVQICSNTSTQAIGCCPYGASECSCNLSNKKTDFLQTGPLFRQKYIPIPGQGSTVTVTAAGATVTVSADKQQGQLTPTSSGGGGGLSAGAAAGIGVGCAIAGLLLGALVVFLLWRMKHKKTPGTVPPYWGMGEEKPAYQEGPPPTELRSNERVEIDTQRHYELPGTSPPMAT